MRNKTNKNELNNKVGVILMKMLDEGLLSILCFLQNLLFFG